MQLQQVNVGYDPEQDRLLLRISTSDKLEYRLLLTRRMVRGMWPGLVQLMQSTPLARQQSAPQAKSAVVEFQRQQALAQAEFGGEYRNQDTRPALPGGAPLLVYTVRMRANPEGGNDLEFLPKQGAGVHMRLQDGMVHALMKLLQDAVASTDWDYTLSFAPEAPAEDAPAPPAPKLN